MESARTQRGVFYLIPHTTCFLDTQGGSVELSVTSKPESGCVDGWVAGWGEFNGKLKREGTTLKRQVKISHERESWSSKPLLSAQRGAFRSRYIPVLDTLLWTHIGRT